MSTFSLIRDRVLRWTFAGLFFGVTTAVLILINLVLLDGLGGFFPAVFFGGVAIVTMSLGAAVLGLVAGLVSHFVLHNDGLSARLKPVLLNVGAVPDRVG